MADFDTDIRNLRRELNSAFTKFNEDVTAGSKKLSSLSKSAEELGKKMHGVVDPASILEKTLNQMGVQYSALKTQSDSYANTMFKARSNALSVKGELIALRELENKQAAAAAGAGAALTAEEQKRLNSLRLQKTNLESARQNYIQIYEAAKENKKTADQQLASLEKQQAVLAVIYSVYATIMSLAENYDKLLSDTAKAQGTTKDEINRQYEAIQKVNTGLSSNLASNQEILAAVTATRKEYALTTSQLATIGKEAANISRLTGLSAEESVKFQTSLAEIGGTSVMAQEAMTVVAAKAAEAAGVPMGQVMRDVANASGAVRTIFKGNTAELIKQAAEARKLGTSLDAAAKSAEALLNFDTSIAAEMKVSALMGQSLNFNESRRLAFAGDLIGAEKALQLEIQKVGDLDKLNYNQRKALAEATGKDFGELQKIQTQRKNMLEAERMFPEEAKKMRKAQEELAALSKKGPEERKKELELLIKQKTAEAELQKLTQAKQEALNNIGKLLQPIYSLIMSIQTGFFKFISLITNLENPIAKWAASGAVGIAALTAAFFALKYGLASVTNFLGNMFANAATAAGKGVGSALSAVSVGLKDLSGAINSFSFAGIAKVALLMGAMALAAWGVSKALENLGTVGAGQIIAFTVGLSVMMVALGALAIMVANPVVAAGLGIITLALLGLGLAAMEVGFGLKMAAPAIDSLGKTLSTLATVVGGVIMKAFETMLGVFQALPDVIGSVAVGLATIANIGFVKMAAAAAGVTAMSSAIYDLGKNLATFPVTQLASITAQIDMLSNSAQGLQYAVESLKELSGVQLPTLEFGGLAAIGALNNTAKKEETSELRAGLEVLANKLDSLIGSMENGGIAVNLDGVRVNYALAKSANQRGALGQATVR